MRLSTNEDAANRRAGRGRSLQLRCACGLYGRRLSDLSRPGALEQRADSARTTSHPRDDRRKNCPDPTAYQPARAGAFQPFLQPAFTSTEPCDSTGPGTDRTGAGHGARQRAARNRPAGKTAERPAGPWRDAAGKVGRQGSAGIVSCEGLVAPADVGNGCVVVAPAQCACHRLQLIPERERSPLHHLPLKGGVARQQLPQLPGRRDPLRAPGKVAANVAGQLSPALPLQPDAAVEVGTRHVGIVPLVKAVGKLLVRQIAVLRVLLANLWQRGHQRMPSGSAVLPVPPPAPLPGRSMAAVPA